MSNYHRQVSRKTARTQGKSRQYINYLARSLALIGLITNGSPLWLLPVIAAPTAPNVTIDNQATGTFADLDDTSTGTQNVVSNTVSVTVAEVAGIIITAANTPTASVGFISNFDFNIQNIGNDPTKFFLPSAPSSITGGTAGILQIVGYIPAGGSKITLSTPIDIITANNTGAIGDGTLGGNTTLGSIPVNAAIVVRVPVLVLSGATNVSVTLGNTSGQPSDINTPYLLGANGTGTDDLYTFDNTDSTVTNEASGTPINGDSSGHRQEASASKSINVASGILDLSGTVFEDVNYGGGAGRELTAATGIVRPNVRVEIYDVSGNYLGKTLTDANGKYSFNATNATAAFVANNSYQIRVVNSFVTSSRTGGCTQAIDINTSPASCTQIPVQTFRTSGDVNTDNIWDADPNRVGGEQPGKIDAPINGSSQTIAALNGFGRTVASLTTVKLAAAGVSGVDFGYNFDTIVNINDNGQGSLRQFVTNSNALTNGGLAQVGQTAGKEVSIFMIPDLTAHPGLSSTYASGVNGTGGNANAAVISMSSQLVITDNNTSIDARTQTTNVADANSGTMGTGGKVGTDGVPLSLIPKPEVVLDFSPMSRVDGSSNPFGGGSNPIVVDAQNTTLAGFAYYGYRITQGLGGLNKGTIWVKPSVLDTGKTIITQLFGGTMADGTKPPTNPEVGSGFQTSGGADISNNYFAYLADAADFDNKNGSHVKFYDNELAYNGPQDNNSINMSGIYADQMETDNGALNITVSGNLVRNSNKLNVSGAQGQGFQMSNATNMTVENNSFIDNNIYGINASTSDSLIQKNIITGTKNGPGFAQGQGIIVYYGGVPLTGLRNRISQNSIYNNVKLGIDRQGDGVTANDGLLSATEPNNGMDYPIITGSSLIGNTLNVKGYIGIDPVGKSIFDSAKIEFFIADNTDSPTQNGAVIINDGKSKPHGEGRTYIGSCTATAVGLFNCSFANAGTLGLTDAKNITATATDLVGNTSEFSAIPSNKADVLMVKRITAITDGVTGTVTPYSAFVDDTTSTTKTNDNNCGWPGANPVSGVCTTNSYTVGATSESALKIKPGDEIEYTIYYLNAGENKAAQARICDRLDSNLTFKDDTLTTLTTTAPLNIRFFPGSLGPVQALTNATGDDQGQLTTPILAGSSCNLTANTGTNLSNNVVVVDVGTVTNPVMGSTGVGMPNTSYGYIRFKTTVK